MYLNRYEFNGTFKLMRGVIAGMEDWILEAMDGKGDFRPIQWIEQGARNVSAWCLLS